MSLESRIIDLLRDGRKIEAIKLFRENSGCGLAEAKYAVEQIETRSGIRDRYSSVDDSSGQDTSSLGCSLLVASGAVLLIVLAGAIVAALFLLRAFG